VSRIRKAVGIYNVFWRKSLTEERKAKWRGSHRATPTVVREELGNRAKKKKNGREKEEVFNSFLSKVATVWGKSNGERSWNLDVRLMEDEATTRGGRGRERMVLGGEEI